MLGLLGLLGFMVVASLIAVEARDLLSAVICVGAAGFGLALVDLLLQAPDLAIVQLVVEILCVTVVIRMVLTRRDTTHETPKDTLILAVVVLCLGLLLAACYTSFKYLNPFGQPLLGQGMGTMADQYLAHGFELTRAANYVMGILLDFRAYDTLGEATVIFVSIVGAYALLRKVGRIRDVTGK